MTIYFINNQFGDGNFYLGNKAKDKRNQEILLKAIETIIKNNTVKPDAKADEPILNDLLTPNKN